jgi:hypothetical protein
LICKHILKKTIIFIVLLFTQICFINHIFADNSLKKNKLLPRVRDAFHLFTLGYQAKKISFSNDKTQINIFFRKVSTKEGTDDFYKRWTFEIQGFFPQIKIQSLAEIKKINKDDECVCITKDLYAINGRLISDRQLKEFFTVKSKSNTENLNIVLFLNKDAPNPMLFSFFEFLMSLPIENINVTIPVEIVKGDPRKK